MKKFLALLLAMVLVVSLAACNGDATPTPDPTAEPTAEPTEEPTAEPTEEPTPEGWAPEVDEVAEEAKVDTFVEGVTGDTEQGPVWFYLSDDGDGVKELFYTPDWGDNWQYSDAPSANDVYYSIFDWEGFKASAGLYAGMNIKTMIAWRAYQDGTVTVGEWDFTALDGAAELDGFIEGAVVSVMLNDEELFTGTTSADGTGNVFEAMDVEVSEGDIIYFVFDGSEAPNANITVADISIAYQ